MPNEIARLVLPKALLRRLEAAGVYCRTWVTAERQARANRWVLRGVESGGGDKDVGRYVSFFSPEGGRLPWLQKLDRIGSNGAHAAVVAPDLTSIEMARVDETYQLLIVSHRLGANAPGKKPRVESKVLFRGVDGRLPRDLLGQRLTPEFFTRGGEVKPVPRKFAAAISWIAAAVSCVHCRHCHGLIERPAADETPLAPG